MLVQIAVSILLFLSLVVFYETADARISVVSVKGQVAYKSGRVWRSLSKVTRLTPGVKISSGYKSGAVIMLDQHRVVVKQLTMIKIYENSIEKLKQRTRIGLRRGSIRAKVNRSSRIKTVFRVSTPVATSSVRGTEKEISFGPAHGMTIKMIEGTSEGESKNGSKKIISGTYVFNQKMEDRDPLPLLRRIVMQSLVPLYNDSSTTFDERRGYRFSGSDVVESYGDSTESIIKIIEDNTASILINITFN